MDHRLGTRTGALRLAFGLTATLAGLDKFFNLLADWSSYISPIALQWLPVSGDAFMHAVGVVECTVGIALLGAAPILGAYAASVWLLLVAVNLLLAGFIDVAVRDVVMSVSALALARLLELSADAPTRSLATDAAREATT